MEDVRWVLDFRFERLSKNADISEDTEEKVFASWAKNSTKESAENVVSTATLPTTARTITTRTTTTGSSPKHPLTATTDQVALIIKFPKTRHYLIKIAIGAEGIVTQQKNAKASSLANASLTNRRSVETQPSRKNIILRRQTYIINLITKALLRLALWPPKV